MWNQTLKKFKPETALQAVLRWCDIPEKLSLISNAINCIYRFECENTAYYLRVTHEKIRSYQELTSALTFQQILIQNKVPICEPIVSQQQMLIETIIQDKLSFMAHVCKEVPGKEVHFGISNHQVYFNWGKALAKLHLASQCYSPPPHCHYLTWRDLQDENRPSLANEATEAKKIYENITEWLGAQTTDVANYGLIHGDHREANVIVDHKNIYFIDFDEPVYHFYSMDIARAFLNICSNDVAMWKMAYQQFIQGYHSLKPLSSAQLGQIPWLVQSKSMEMYLWTKNHWHDPVVPGGGSTKEWLVQLYKNAINPDYYPIFSSLNKELCLGTPHK